MELWSKFDIILSNILESNFSNYKESGGIVAEFSSFDKDGIMILMQIMGEKRLTNPTICKYLFMDIEHYIKLNKFSLEEITFFIDFYYRLNFFNSDHIEEIVS